MKNYIFGIEAEEHNGSKNDFVLNRGAAADGGDNNPYHKEFLADPRNRKTIKGEKKITSIPSPYARMHLTDLAFEEWNCGIGISSASELALDQAGMSPDYKKALSHCLDVFELMYHADEFNLSQLGITLHKLNLLSTKTNDASEREVLFDSRGELTSVGKYIKTLDLYRDAYMSMLNKRMVGANLQYKFDFSSLYMLKYKGKVFAATSPFTGFFTKPDCDLSEANIKINNRLLFSPDENTWLDCKGRDPKFIEFLYLLLKDSNLDKLFVNLFNSVDYVVSLDQNWKVRLDTTRFSNTANYSKFNMFGTGLLQVPNDNSNKVYVRPDGLDCSYLKYLLYLQNPVDLTIHPSEYEKPLNERTFDGNLLQWIGVNDILSDALFVLPYDVNDNYTVISYTDATRGGAVYRRCLVPIKSGALQYFSLDELIQNMTIDCYEQGVFVVSLKLNLAGGVSIVLRREYHHSGDDNNVQFPNGKLIQGTEMKPFAFGVYPFVKSASDLNIYKVLFYNVFKSAYRLDFYRKDANGRMVQLLRNNNEHVSNKTNNHEDQSVGLNCEYHHLEHNSGFEFAELVVGNYSSLIIPRLRNIPTQPNPINVAIDLGTSNTFIAYRVVDIMDPSAGTNCQICTEHDEFGMQWNELTFMNKRCEDSVRPAGVNVCNSDDLVVKLHDDDNMKATSDMLDHQLCEFIPSRINPNENSSYQFPIPSVINFLRVDTQRLSQEQLPESNPLINTAIPFAYYERGMRVGSLNQYYDTISKGSTFKWYITRNSRGDYDTKPGGQAAFQAFIRELLFIVRCHILSKGYQLSNVNVYWSYPLAFENVLLSDYINAWETAFTQIIDRNIYDANGKKRVHYTCESRSPIYECINPVNIKQLTLLVDIGGGSTDVIGYKDFKPLFVSSTKFAGNALYFCGALNNPAFANQFEGNLMYKYVKKIQSLRDVTPQRNGDVATQTIGLTEDMATIMNYGFVKYPREFRQIFNNRSAEFMLKLHNSALLYHIAQLCYTKSPDEAPSDIYLTGNGSKQLLMNVEYKSLICKIFGYVYGGSVNTTDGIGITFPQNPKAATAIGTLKGIQLGIALDSDSVGDSYIPLGDGKSILEKTEDGAQLTPDCKLENIFENAKNFVEMFYNDIYKVPTPSITKEDMIAAIDSCKNTMTLDSNLIDDSLFLRLISEVMEKLSDKLARDM